MARKKKEDAPKGSPGWMNTFADLMNLLLCFFVLLFSMSTVDAQKFEQVVASLQSTFNILPNGGASIGEGLLISSGVSQLELLDEYYNEQANSNAQEHSEAEQEVEDAYREQALEESEEMAEAIEQAAARYGIQNDIEVDFNAEYVLINMNGALLFDSGRADLRAEAYPLIDKVGKIIAPYDANIIDVEGHTDNIPMSSGKYENNNVLSMYRALTVADYLREITNINPGNIESSGRGDYAPIADNSTPEGRARNRRVEIKIYNSYFSNLE